VGWYWRGKKALRDKPVPGPIYSVLFPQWPSRNRKGAHFKRQATNRLSHNTAPMHFSLGTGWRCVVSFKLRPSHQRDKSPRRLLWGCWSRFLCFDAARRQANFGTLKIKEHRVATASCDTAQTDALQVTSTTDLNPPINNSVWIGLKEAGRLYSCTADFMRRFSNRIVYDVTRIFAVLCSRPIQH
jgi:hypothetical protein